MGSTKQGTGHDTGEQRGYDAHARARWVTEPAKTTAPHGRTSFARDRARLVHSAALLPHVLPRALLRRPHRATLLPAGDSTGT